MSQGWNQMFEQHQQKITSINTFWLLFRDSLEFFLWIFSEPFFSEHNNRAENEDSSKSGINVRNFEMRVDEMKGVSIAEDD